MILDRLFLSHPRAQNESYLEHGRFAASVGSRMVLGGLACMVHAVLPFAFTTTGSRTIGELSARLARRALPAAGAGSRHPDARAAPVRG